MAVVSSVRKAVGALSVSLLVETDNSGDTREVRLTNADLLAGATEQELATFPIYRDFLNRPFETDLDLITKFAELGAVIIGVNVGASVEIDPNTYFVRDEENETYKPEVIFGAQAGYSSIRIALAHTIAS